MEDRQNPKGVKRPVQIGRFRLLEPLGHGAMATVYLAEMQGRGGFLKKVALKVFHPLPSESEPDLSFTSEARLGGFLSHPNLIEVFDFGEHDGQPFLAMELVQGVTLHELMASVARMETRLPVDIALQIMIELCRGMAYAHGALDAHGRPLQIVHRDLKPANILINRHGQVKIGDFGIARAESNLEKTLAASVVKGTLRYMSPEQARASLEIDRRSDVFSLGTILYELMTLQPLYNGSGFEAGRRQEQDTTVEARLKLLQHTSYPDGLLPLVRRAVAFSPADRFQTCDALMEALEGLLGTLPRRSDLRAWLTQRSREIEESKQAGSVVARSAETVEDLRGVVPETMVGRNDGFGERSSTVADPLLDQNARVDGLVETTDVLDSLDTEAARQKVTSNEVAAIPEGLARPKKITHWIGLAAGLSLGVLAAVLIRAQLDVATPERGKHADARGSVEPAATLPVSVVPTPTAVPIPTPPQSTPIVGQMGPPQVIPAPAATPTPKPAIVSNPPRQSTLTTAVKRPRQKVIESKSIETEFGTLFANSIPESIVRVDGKAQTMFPVRALKLPAGRHHIRFDRKDGGAVDETFVLAAGKTVRCVTRFQGSGPICTQDPDGEKE